MYKKRLLELEISADLKGFEYLNYALEIYKPLMSKMAIYELIGKQYGDSVSKIERAIRHAISKTGQNLTNGQFVAKYKILWDEGYNNGQN